MPSICAADQSAGRTSPASQSASLPGDRGHLASALDVGGQELSTRGGPLGLVELVSVVRVHDGPSSGRAVVQTTNAHPPMDTRAEGRLAAVSQRLAKRLRMRRKSIAQCSPESRVAEVAAPSGAAHTDFCRTGL